jgi:two-component system, OmpR family, sensor kinase
MRSRLRFSLYLSVLVLIFVIGGLVLSFRIFITVPLDKLDRIAFHVAENVFSYRDHPGLPERYLRELSGGTPISLTLFDRERRAIASMKKPAPSAEVLQSAQRDPGHRYVVHEIHDRRAGGHGELLGYALLDHIPSPPPGLLIGLCVLLGALALLVVTITLHVGAPLQRIATAARAFGRGDLKARTGLVRKDELGDAGRAFDEMADRVTSLMAAERELMANISHELQTPLARIRVAVDLICDGISDRSMDILPEISRDLGEIDRLIDDVMTNSRLDFAAGSLTTTTLLRREQLRVPQLLDHVEARFFALHPDRTLVVEQQPDLPSLFVDPVLVRRLLENLLSNAAKYSELPEPITLRATLTDLFVVFEISDRGIGIDPADLPSLFTPFFRTDRSRSRTTGGTGLGLVLARRIVLAHGGNLSLQSTPHQGTTVTFSLPIEPSPPLRDSAAWPMVRGAPPPPASRR